MIYNYQGRIYTIEFIQEDKCYDESPHLFTRVYKFYSKHTKLNYILTAHYHENDVFSIKYYAKIHKKSDNKYSILTNRGYCTRVVMTAASIIPELLKIYPTASFGLVAARTIDVKSKRIEPTAFTQRFKLYTDVAKDLFGTKTFQHFSYQEDSAYLLLNKSNGNIQERELQIRKMFMETYNGFDLNETIEIE